MPVPVDIMIERLGANIVPRKNMLQRIGIDAFWNPNFTALYIDEDRYMSSSNYRGRFTLAHEIGHYVLHKDHSKEFSNMEEWKNHILGKTALRKIEEMEANDFAGFLLIPTKELRLKFEELKSSDTSYEEILEGEIDNSEIMRYFTGDLAKYFQVSRSCMEIRIKYFR